MGRKKITIQKIENKKDRLITFCKRKLGLLKKAAEISTLCEVNVYLAFTDLNGAVYQFDSFRDNSSNNRNTDMATTLEKIKSGNFVSYDLNQYPFDELKNQQPTQADLDREDFLKSSSEIGLYKQGDIASDLEGLYTLPNTSIGHIKNSLDRVLNPSGFIPQLKSRDDLGPKVSEIDHRNSNAHDLQSSFGINLSVQPPPLIQQQQLDPFASEKFSKKVTLMNASLENSRSEQSLWSFVQSKAEELEPILLETERLKKIRARFRRDFLTECNSYKLCQTRNDLDINELVLLFYFVDKYIEISIDPHGPDENRTGFISRILSVCSGSIMLAIACNFSFRDALSSEGRTKTRVLAEYFLRRFLDPTFHQYSPPNYMMVNTFCHLLVNYLQNINLFLALSGARPISSTTTILETHQLTQIERLMDITLRVVLAKEMSSRDGNHFPDPSLGEKDKEKRHDPIGRIETLPFNQNHVSYVGYSGKEGKEKLHHVNMNIPSFPSLPINQLESKSVGARIFGGKSGFDPVQKKKPEESTDIKVKIEHNE